MEHELAALALHIFEAVELVHKLFKSQFRVLLIGGLIGVGKAVFRDPRGYLPVTGMLGQHRSGVAQYLLKGAVPVVGTQIAAIKDDVGQMVEVLEMSSMVLVKWYLK